MLSYGRTQSHLRSTYLVSICPKTQKNTKRNENDRFVVDFSLDATELKFFSGYNNALCATSAIEAIWCLHYSPNPYSINFYICPITHKNLSKLQISHINDHYSNEMCPLWWLSYQNGSNSTKVTSFVCKKTFFVSPLSTFVRFFNRS